jgi:hypothetical protein
MSEPCADCKAMLSSPTAKPRQFEGRLAYRPSLPDTTTRDGYLFTWWTCAQCRQTWQRRQRLADELWSPTGIVHS